MSKSSGAVALFTVVLVVAVVFGSKSVVFGSPGDGRMSINRPDPLRHLHYYHGSYDLANKHYWASTAFTGIHGFVIAGIWMLFGLAFAIFVIVKQRSGSFLSTRYSDRYYVVSFLLLVFTVLAITASGFAYAGNHQSLKRTRNLKNSIVETGEDACETIQRVAKTLTGIQYLLLPYEPDKSFQLNVTTHKLGNESRTISSFVQQSGHSIDKAITTSASCGCNPQLGLSGGRTSSSPVALPPWIHHYNFAMLDLNNSKLDSDSFVADTCSAFEDFVQNPQNNSLSSVLPCVDSSYSTKLLADIGFTISGVIKQINSKIGDAIWSLGLEDKEVLKFRKICDPFTQAPNYSYAPQLCAESHIKIGDLLNVLENFTCYNQDSAESCKNEGKFVSESNYYKAWAYSGSIQKILDIYPDLRSLAECTVVKFTFSDVIPRQCKLFRVAVKRLWSSMLSLSIFMAVLVLIWVAEACQER
ncbi:hypothetical protein LWI28_002271 [Acer negundo]|uniref:Transmembrane protein n=1 Tax=Acer negundo TaxID=4023 RepID=A0AAD5IIF4_ACENE|nr:hypothetical protein LWI28_002271 [Acer negundo]KAK4844268.1 hypothetical protein QYF36_018299 [Acer negundo]